MTRALPKAILFDLDDTILNFSGGADECWLACCEAVAPRLQGSSPASVYAAIQEYRVWYWADPERHRVARLNMNKARTEIVAVALQRCGIDDADLASEIALDFAARRDVLISLFPGAVETLQYLREHGIKLALITNGAALAQRGKIERFQLAPWFDCIIVEGEFGIGKPDEQVYRHALAQLHVTPAETWMVGDNLEWEVATPQRLGIYSIWVDAAGRGLPADSQVRPDQIIRQVADLIESE